MDAEISVAGLIEEADGLIEGGDLEGAELMLTRALIASPQLSAFFHYQLGRLYGRWNKLSSTVAHFHQALESLRPQDEILKIQIVQELKRVREQQLTQRP